MAAEDDHRRPRIGLLITAAGFSTRMGGEEKKEYRRIGPYPVLVHTLLAFIGPFGEGSPGRSPYIERSPGAPFEPHEICITVPEGHETRVKNLIVSTIPKAFAAAAEKIRFTEGGDTRQESVLRGLESFSGETGYVLIHDGARPWVSGDLIRRIVQDVIAHDAVIPVIPITDAVKRIDRDHFIDEHLDRGRSMGAQTPQAFTFPSVLEAHRRARSDGFTYIDDSEIYSRYIGTVHTVTGDPENIKITFPRDIAPAETIRGEGDPGEPVPGEETR